MSVQLLRPATTRPLRGLELGMAKIHDSMGPEMVIGIVHGTLDVARLESAAATLQARHPSLRARIIKRAGRLHFEYLPPERSRLDLKQVALPCGSDEQTAMQHVVEAEMCRPFDAERGYMFRVRWFTLGAESHGVLCAVHHAAADAQSLYRILHELLSGHAGSCSRTETAPLAPSAPVLDYVENAPFGLAFEAVRNELGSRLRFALRRPFGPSQRSDARCLSAFHVGSRGGWEKLRATAKRASATVGGTFTAAALLALHEHAANAGMQQSGATMVTASVSLRERLQPNIAREHVGLYVSTVRLCTHVEAHDDLASMAGRLSRALHTMITDGHPQRMHQAVDAAGSGALLKGLLLLSDWTGGPLEPLAVSNVGPYPYESGYGALKLDQVYGLNAVWRTGPALMFWLRFLDGRLCYNAAAAGSLFARPALQQMLSRVHTLLES